jgi:hypothetical protein
LDIAVFIAREEDFLGEAEDFLDTLKARWGNQRRRLHEAPIKLPEVLRIARRGCIS